MSTIVTRAGKGSPLTNTEMDTNLTNLNTDKLEINPALGTPTSGNLGNCTNAVAYGLKSATTTVSVSAATAPTAGQVLVATADITATWQTLSSGISNIVTATTATTLTSTKTLLQITPASYGVAVTLPDATTCTEGGPLHIIDNKGAYPVKVLNSAGTLLGFIFAGVVSHISLIDNATAAGVWSGENFELVGASAQFLSANFNTAIKTVALDSDRDFIIGTKTGTAVYGKVHRKSTNSYSADTIIRNADCAANIELILQSTNQVLVVSCTSGSTAFEAVICSVDAGTDAITPNAAATATLSGNISAFADGCGLIAVGTSFITSYTVATPAAQIREITVSGTTPTISAATVLDGTAGGLIVAGDATHVIAVSTATTHLYTKPYTIGGLAAGTGTDTNTGTATLYKFTPLGTRWAVVYLDGTNLKGGIISLSGTTTTVSFANLFGVVTCSDAIVTSSSKMLVLSNGTQANILTDSAGTASAGTAMTTLQNTGAKSCLYVSGTDVAMQEGTTTYEVKIIDCSGASPVLSRKLGPGQGLSNATNCPAFQASNAMLSRSPAAVYGTAYAETVYSGVAVMNSAKVRNGVFFLGKKLTHPFENSSYGYRGASASQIWQTDGTSVITKVECVA